jgi:phosphatidylserine/phosphatidylglycerophosphate/cardiolipin synthase-like enzyme
MKIGERNLPACVTVQAVGQEDCYYHSKTETARSISSIYHCYIFNSVADFRSFSKEKVDKLRESFLQNNLNKKRKRIYYCKRQLLRKEKPMRSLRSSYFVLFLYFILSAHQLIAHVVISEVYGGGGNSGSVWKNDFIELYNPADTSVSLDGWSVQYIAATGAGTWKMTNLSGIIAPHAFYLVQEDSGASGTTYLPTPDAAGNLAIAATAGKIALCSTVTALTGANPVSADIIDLVGFGTTANFYEGSGPAPAPSNTRSVERKASSASTAETMGSGGAEEFLGNGYDSNNNSSDFFTRIPEPQNSASTREWPGRDGTPPVVDSVRILSDTQIEIFFNEAVESLSSSDNGNYLLNKGILVTGAQRDTINFDRVLLTLSALSNDIYTLTVQHIKDLAGNEMAAPIVFSVSFGVLTVAQARSAEIGTLVRVRGIVTAARELNSPSFIQDSTAGIAVMNSNFTASACLGDMWEIAGRLKEYNNQLCIDSLVDTICVSTGNPLPLPKLISASQAGEMYEGQLVCITEVSFAESGFFTGGTSGTTYHITDGTTRVDVRISSGSSLEGAAIPGGIIHVKGILGQYYSRYQVMPRTISDIEQLPGPVIESPPIITALTDTSFTVSWTTSNPGYSHLAFGTSPAFDDSLGTPISSLVTSHSLTVPGRTPGRLYYFRAATTNADGTSFSAIYPVVTTSPQSSGQMNVYFNYSVDGTLGLEPPANGSTDLLLNLLERISHASKSIDLALYSFDDFSSSTEIVANRVADSLIAAKNRGVAIRMVFDDKQTTAPLQKLVDAGIPVQKRNIIGNSGIMHNKIFIFDGRDTTSALDDWVINGSWNVTNLGTYEDAQNAVFIQDQSLARIYTVEFEEMFGSSNETPHPELARFGPAKLDNTPHVTSIHGMKVEVSFSPSDQTTSRIIQALSTADNDIFFGVMSFTRNDIAQSLITKYSSGVRVHGIINDPSGSVLGTLQSSGIDAMQAEHSVVTGLFHHKYAVVDPFNDASDPLVITGSHNWSTNAETDNDENTLIIHSGALARQYVQEFSERYKESGGSRTLTGVQQQKNNKPLRFELLQNYPNPFNPETVISYSIPTTGYVSLKVYDILGRETATLVHEMKSAGTYTLNWNASRYASGVYFYQLRVGSFVDTKKLVLMR